MCSSALLFCQLYFPYLPHWVCLLFFFSLFPSSLPPQHYITLALTHYLMPLLPFGPHQCPEQGTSVLWTPSNSSCWWIFCFAAIQEQQHYSAMNQGFVQEEMLVYQGRWGGGHWVSDVWERKLWKSCFVVLAALHHSESLRYQVCWSANIVVSFRTLWGPLLSPKVEHGSKVSWSMWVERNVWRGLTGDGDEESDGGLCCSSFVERNAAVMSRLQEGACLMTQSPDLHAPPSNSHNPH